MSRGVVAVLQRARERLSSGESIGAIVDDMNLSLEGTLAYRAIVKHCAPWNVSGYAARHSHRDVLKLVDRAIVAARAAEGE